MPNELKQLKLEELSLVDRPANAQAMVSLFKRDDAMSEETNKGEQEVETVAREEFDTVKAENERLRKFLIDNEYVIKAETIEKKEPMEQIDVNGEMVNKADIPAPVLKALEEAAVEKKEAELRKRASEELPNFDEKVAMDLLKYDLDEETMKALKAADATFETAMEEVGKTETDGEMSDPATKLEKMVEETMQEKNVSKFAAYEMVAKTKEGKALINKTYKKEV